MKGQHEAEGPSEESNIGQLQRRPLQENNKQKSRTTNRTIEQQTEQYSIEQMVSLRDMSYLIKSF